MLDYKKIWINDVPTIQKVLSNPRIKKEFTSNEEGELIGVNGRFENWKIKTLSSVKLEISGSIHKYWNKGTNENDFTFQDALLRVGGLIGVLVTPFLKFPKIQPLIDQLIAV